MTELLPLVVLGVVVVTITVIHDRSTARAARDRVAETERILAAFVETTVSSHRNLSNVYAPDPTPARPDVSGRVDFGDDIEYAESYDDWDPTDDIIQRRREEAIMDNGSDNAFGIPGLHTPVLPNGTR